VAHILLLSDLHLGSEFAVLPRVAYRTTDNTRTRVQPTPSQRYLLKCWRWMVGNLPAKLAYTIVNGDTLDGENPKEAGLYVNLQSPSDQAEAALELLGPIRERSEKFFLVKGSPYHEGRGADAVAGLAKALQADRWSSGLQTGTRLWLQMKKAADLVLNASHHMTRGWIYPAGGADRTAMMAAVAEASGKLPRADIIVRGHNHLKRVVSAHGKTVIFQPAWKLLTPFVERLMEEIRAEVLSDLGAVLIEVTSTGRVNVDDTTFSFQNLWPRLTSA